VRGLRIILLGFLFCVTFACSPGPEEKMADLVLLNGSVWTVNPDQPWAEAVAMKGEKILEVGSTAEIKKAVGNKTQVIDLNGDLVLPGFIDSHTHFLDGGFSLLSIQLREVKSREEFVSRIKERAAGMGKGEWILNGNWDHQSFDPPELPRKEWVDEVTPHNPVCINRHDGHMVLANSLALKIAGITRETLSPEGGEILKDRSTGEPTGILKDAAMELVMKHIPEPSLQVKMKAAEVALKRAADCGVTSVHDMAYAGNVEVYQELFTGLIHRPVFRALRR